MPAGKLFLINLPIHDEGKDTIPEATVEVIQHLHFFSLNDPKQHASL